MKKIKKFISVMLALIMVIGMIPITSLTAFATTKTEVTKLSFAFRSEDDIPAVGDPVTYRSSGTIVEVEDDLITLTASGLSWHDAKGAVINDTFDDHGYYFEAGRTYYAEIVAKLNDPETYKFSENAVITLTNPGDFTYTAKVVDITDTLGGGHYATIRLTITMNGQRTYPDITKVVFEDTAAPAADGGTISADLYYNNCTITDEGWYDVNNIWVSGFVAGETYTRRIVLTAKDGYAFDENVDEVLTHVGVPQEPTGKVLSQNNTVLTLTYTYTIAGITRIDNVEAQLVYYYVNPTPYAGDTPTSLNNFITVAENHPYEKISDVGRFWYDEDGNGIDNKEIFEAGKTYYFEIAYSIKDEYESEYRFSRGDITALITGGSYTGKGFQKAERVEDNTFDDTYVKIRYYFTAQFPEGKEDTENNPVICNNFAYPNAYELDSDYGLNGSGIYWYDCEGRELENGEKFADAHPYCIAVKFVPASTSDGKYLTEFAEEVQVFIDGKQVTEYGQWDKVVVGSGTVWAYFTFRNGSSAPVIGLGGDVDNDGTISNSDLITLARYVVGLNELDGVQLINADMNGDGEVSNSDIIEIARYIVGL